MIKNTTLSVLLISVAATSSITKLLAETQTATVTPGSHEVVEFDGDESGLYQLNIQAGSGHTINDSDFTAEFKADTLWQRNSKTSYSITYTEKPKPPGVSVKGDFETSGGDGRGYSPNDFLVDVPNVDCEPKDKELIARHMGGGGFGSNTNGGHTLWLAEMRAYAFWKPPEGCTCNVGVCQNAKFNATITYSDGSSIGVSTNFYLLDGGYPHMGGGGSGENNEGKKFRWVMDQPWVSTKSSDDTNNVQEMTYTLTAEDFFMVIPHQGPPLSKMIVTWWSSGKAKRTGGALSLDSQSSSPNQQGWTAGSNSDRPPVAQGETANTYINRRWKKLSGSQNSMADNYLNFYNTK